MPSTDPPPSRHTALTRLEAFAPSAGRAYAARRNLDPGPDAPGHVSRLSPYLRHRVLLETEVAAAAIARHGYGGAEKFVQEVFWRTYFKGWLEQHPRAWQDYLQGAESAHDALDDRRGLAGAYAAAIAGRTGIEAFDAWASELVETGYLHNHARMWFASIWIFTLALPWQLGAEFFLTHLNDGDPASNTLSWRWVAGLHTRGKTYLARPDNIAKFTDGRFRPRPDELAQQAPALEERDPPPREPLALPAGDTVAPDDFLVLVDDDLHFESLLDTTIAGAAVVDTSARRTALGLAPAAAAFIAHLVAGRADDLRNAHNCPVRTLTLAADAKTGAEDTDATIDALLAEVADSGARRIVCPYAPVGPGATFVAHLEKAAAGRLPVVSLVRDMDRAMWPHADRGYFKLKKQLPALVRELGLDTVT